MSRAPTVLGVRADDRRTHIERINPIPDGGSPAGIPGSALSHDPAAHAVHHAARETVHVDEDETVSEAETEEAETVDPEPEAPAEETDLAGEPASDQSETRDT